MYLSVHLFLKSVLLLVFKQGGVLPWIVVDNWNEQTLGNFSKKCHKVDYHLVTTELYVPWMQVHAAEECIKQTKRGYSQKMLKLGSPKSL